MNQVFTIASIFIISLIVGRGCADYGTSVPTDIPASQLQTSPDTITVEGRRLYLATSLWRDFQPISPPDGKPLIAIIYVSATDAAPLTLTISADAIWVVYNDQVWKSWFTNEPIPPDPAKPNRIVRIAREGPKWGPHVYVDVIVRVNDGRGNSQLLLAANQWIDRTD